MAAFLDRVNVGFAKERMVADLGLSNAVYGLGAGIFFLGYFLFEVPSNLVLERVGARIWIARIMIVWGLVSASMIFVRGATSFYALRFLLGAAEAGFFPGIIFYLTCWFPASYRSRTVAVFMTAAVLSSVVGSPLSGVLLDLDGTWGLQGWKWLFMVEALPAILLGTAVFFRLPASPREAAWLTVEELVWLQTRLTSERTTVGAGAGHEMTIRQALTHPRVLLLCAIYFGEVIGGYGLDFFLPTLMRQTFPLAGAKALGLLIAIPSLFAAFVMVAHGRSSDRSNERRFHFAIAVFCAASGLVITSLPVPRIVALAALVLAVAGRWSAVAPFWGLSTTFLSGTAAAGAIALINSVGNLGGFFGPSLVGMIKDKTGSSFGGLVLLGACYIGVAILAFALPKTMRREASSA